MNNTLLFLLFTLLGLASLAQTRICISEPVDSIAFYEDWGGVELMAKAANDRWNYFSFDYKEISETRYSIQRDGYTSNSANELDKGGFTISPQDLLPMDSHEFGKQFEAEHLEPVALEIIEDNDRWVIYRLNGHILLLETYYLDSDDDNKAYWELDEVTHHPYFFVEIGDKRMIAITEFDLNGLDNFGYIAFTHTKPLIVVDDIDFSKGKAIKQTRQDLLDRLMFADAWHVQFDYNLVGLFPDGFGTQSQRFVNTFGDPVIEGSYNSFRFINHIVIAEKDSLLELFTLDFMQDPVTVRSVYTYYGENPPYLLQVLQGNSLKVLDHTLAQLPDDSIPRPRSFTVCGNVPSWRYTITDSVLRKIDGDLFLNEKITEQTVDLSPVDYDRISLISKHDTEYFDYHSFQYGFTLQGSEMVFKKNGKSGLLVANFNIDKPPLLKVVLPARYDAIEFEYYRKPVKLKKGGLYGWYPQTNEAKYSKLKAFDRHFSRFELPDGRQGWIDLEGNEYLDELHKN